MSEMLKSSGEKSTENKGSVTGFEALAEMNGKFDPNRAKSLVERDQPKSAEKTKVENKSAGYLIAVSEKQEKELSPADAANEYLSLMDELSQGFTNPYYKNGVEHRGEQHTANHILRDLGLKYSNNPHYRHFGYIGTEANNKKDGIDYTLERMGVADAIIGYEIGWKEEGAKVGEKIGQIDKSIADLDAAYAEKGKIGKFFGKRKYEKARKELEDSKWTLKYQFNQKYNKHMEKELAIAYNDRGNYDFNGGDYGRSKNEERNRQFFGLDDPGRAKKVERAMELRQKYKAEWTKKK